MPLWVRPGYLLRRLHQIHYALFFEECSDFDITPVQYGLLTTLSLNPDLDQNSIGRELGIDRTNVADVLARLARRGLLERHRSKQDKRMVLARLTPAGQRVTDEMYAAMLKAQNRLLAPREARLGIRHLRDLRTARTAGCGGRGFEIRWHRRMPPSGWQTMRPGATDATHAPAVG